MESFDSMGSLFLLSIPGRNESALRELGCAELHGGLPPTARRRFALPLQQIVNRTVSLQAKLRFDFPVAPP